MLGFAAACDNAPGEWWGMQLVYLASGVYGIMTSSILNPNFITAGPEGSIMGVAGIILHMLSAAALPSTVCHVPIQSVAHRLDWMGTCLYWIGWALVYG